MKRNLTEDEKKIYEKSLIRLRDEINDLDLLIRSQKLTVEEVLAYNYKMTRKREEAYLQDLKDQYDSKILAFEDSSNKLRDGFVEVKEEE